MIADMDINTEKLSQLDFLSPALKAGLVQKSPQIFLYILVVMLSIQLAETGWKVVDTFFQPVSIGKSIPVVPQTRPSAQQKQMNYQALANIKLFGARDSKAVIEKAPLSAPETRLNLILFGIFAGDDLKEGSAIIGSKAGKQKFFNVGDKVDTGVWLAEVRKDHVLLKRGVSFEVLKFPKPKSTGVTIKRAVKPAPQVNLSGNKQAFMDNVRIVPVFAGKGKGLKGYRIMPKKNRALYNKLGLRPSDIVTSINGISLSNEREAMKVVSELVKSDQVEVEVERGGQVENLTLNLK